MHDVTMRRRRRVEMDVRNGWVVMERYLQAMRRAICSVLFPQPRFISAQIVPKEEADTRLSLNAAWE